MINNEILLYFDEKTNKMKKYPDYDVQIFFETKEEQEEFGNLIKKIGKIGIKETIKLLDNHIKQKADIKRANK